jgi:hypothetical protein
MSLCLRTFSSYLLSFLKLTLLFIQNVDNLGARPVSSLANERQLTACGGEWRSVVHVEQRCDYSFPPSLCLLIETGGCLALYRAKTDDATWMSIKAALRTSLIQRGWVKCRRHISVECIQLYN